MEFDLDTYQRAVRTLRVRRCGKTYNRPVLDMSMEQFLFYIRNRRDKLHGIGSDTAWDVLLTRKPEKYERWI